MVTLLSDEAGVLELWSTGVMVSFSAYTAILKGICKF
jgi:hypothetical protein